MKLRSLALIALPLVLGLACKSSSPKSPAKKSSNGVPTSDNDSAFDTPPLDDCKTSSSGDDDFDLRSFLGLQSSKVTYDSDVKAILQQYCVSCHSGVTAPDVSSYSAAKSAASAIAASVKPGASSPMPPSGGMSQSEKDKLAQWITDGTLESSSSTSGSSTNDCDDLSSGDDDEEDDDSDDDDEGTAVADWDEFLNPDRLKECKDDGKVFDRVKNDCHKAKIADFTCERAAIVDEFKAFTKAYDDIIDDGYVLDQCGDYNGDPIILFYKKNETSSELKLKIRKLCKKDSPACS